MLLRNKRRLPEAVRAALRLVLPEDIAEKIEHMPLPGAAVMSRSMLKVDALLGSLSWSTLFNTASSLVWNS